MNTTNQILNNLCVSRDRFAERKNKLVRLSRKFSIYRLFIFLTGMTLFFLVFFLISSLPAWMIFVLTFIAFGITARIHNNINFGIKKNTYWIKIREAQIARIKIDWDKIPSQGVTLADQQHPFDADLNITGTQSLHRLIDTSISAEGSRILKSWLLNLFPDKNIIKARQELVKEIKPLHRFRDKLLLNSMMVSPEKMDSSGFIDWLRSENNIAPLKRLVTAGFILNILFIISLIVFLLAGNAVYFSIMLLIYTGLYLFNLNLVKDAFEKAEHIEEELGKFYSVLTFIENYSFGKNDKLKNFCAPLTDEKTSPRIHFRRIRNLMNVLSLRRNPLMLLILNLLMPWDFYFTLRLEREKQSLADNLNEWLDTWHTLLALNSLAEFAWLNPDYHFPQLSDKEGILKASGIGHPLIGTDRIIRNDFEITGTGRVDIITGSNMSGKSTFLKTLGTNLVLAYAGAPVNAFSFNIGLFRIFTCIKIDDSVTDGISYFYAEVKRLKRLLDSLETPDHLPLFFLIDEIFRGTNNRERIEGSRSYIKSLGNKKGSGLISTHDLELVKLEGEMDFIRNFHFREEASGGKLVFDYQLREGPSPTTNALKIMKLEGLPVD